MAAHQAPLSLGFSRREYWSGLPFPSSMHARMLRRVSRVGLSATLQTAAHQAPLSTGFSRQEYWSGLPFPSPFELQGSTIQLGIIFSKYPDKNYRVTTILNMSQFIIFALDTITFLSNSKIY